MDAERWASLTAAKSIIFTAMSKYFMAYRDAVCEYVFLQGGVPINPFRAYDYFLGNRVDHDLVRAANNNLIRISDELWVFGPVADGVLAEVFYAPTLGKPVRFFAIASRAQDMRPLELGELEFERDVCTKANRPEMIGRIAAAVA